jgi:D-amino peptidase
MLNLMTISKLKKFAIRSDMEGLHGVVDYCEVTPGVPLYPWAQERLHDELRALAEGFFAGGADVVDIYDEHFDGRNIDVSKLPKGVSVIRGKPPYRADWAGGVDESFSGVVLQGLHAMAGVAGGTLSHTYEPDIAALHINGQLVGEIGMEAAIAGDVGVPVVLVLADSAGTDEAKALLPCVETVAVKDALGYTSAYCRDWRTVEAEIREKARRIAEGCVQVKPLRFGGSVELVVTLNPGPYADCLWKLAPELRTGHRELALRGKTVLALWADYWALKLRVFAALKTR